jgi:cell division protein FtsB
MGTVEKALHKTLAPIITKQLSEVTALLRKEQAQMQRRLRRLEKELEELRQRIEVLSGQAVAAQRRVTLRDFSARGITAIHISGQAIRRLRRRLGLSQEAFGRLVGVSGQSVYYWERRQGALRLRHNSRRAILELQNMRKQDIQRNLKEIFGRM